MSSIYHIAEIRVFTNQSALLQCLAAEEVFAPPSGLDKIQRHRADNIGLSERKLNPVYLFPLLRYLI